VAWSNSVRIVNTIVKYTPHDDAVETDIALAPDY